MAFSRNTFLGRLAGSMREVGFYAAVALIVPGGSLIALSLWALRNRRAGARSVSLVRARGAAVAPTCAPFASGTASEP